MHSHHLSGYDPDKWDRQTSNMALSVELQGKVDLEQEGVLEQARSWRMMRIVRIVEGFKGELNTRFIMRGGILFCSVLHREHLAVPLSSSPCMHLRCMRCVGHDAIHAQLAFTWMWSRQMGQRNIALSVELQR